MATVPTTGAPPQVTLSMQQGMQLMTMRQTPTQGNVMQPQQVRSLTPRMILSPQVVQNAVRTSQPGVIPGAQAGQHLLVKTQNGEMHLVRVNSSGQATPVSTGGNSTGQLAVTSSHVSLNHQVVNSNNAIMSGTGTTTILPHSQQYRFQSQVASSTSSAPTSSMGSVINSTSSNLSNSTITNHTSISNNNSILNSTLLNSSSSPSPTSSILINQLQQGSVQQATNQAQSTAGQIISAESAKNKCKNFLSTLLKLAADQKQIVAISVRSLIQGLIDGHVEPETFTEELQKDLNSSPQPCLVPFLKKTLPYLRLSLAKGEITIEGVNAPPMTSVSGAAPGATTVIPNNSSVLRAPVQQQQLRPPTKAVSAVVAPSLTGTRVPNSIVVQSTSPHIQIPMANGGSPQQSVSNTSLQPSQTPMVLRSSISTKVTNAKDRPKDKANFASYNSFSSSNVADDDINDVAAMGGVNLGEESQRILDSTGFVGTQIRSVKDETFLISNNVQQRLRLICGKYDLEEPSKEFSALLSHAVQERLKTALEKLSIAAEHRLDIVKNEPKYEVVQDVKSQLKFIEDLDRLEKKRKDEVEREILLRAAKSRNKNEDPDQAKLKAKAKEMQRVEMEEMRQRDANMAALKALQGPRKRAKLDINSQEEGGSHSGALAQKTIPVRQRTKRVNLRDLTFMMEQEKELNKSSLLYKAYLK